MNALDLAVVAVLVTSMVGGYRLGLLEGGTAWVFLLQSLVVATLLIPVLVGTVGDLSPALALVASLLFFLVSGFAGHQLGRLVGRHFRRELALGAHRRADSVAGAVGGLVAVVATLWLLVLPSLSQVSGWSADLVHGSAVSSAIESALPSPPDASPVVRRLAGPAASPQVFGGLLPSLDTGPPPNRVRMSPTVRARAAASTVKVEGVACESERDGSGFTVAPDLVVTNAHVVAGEAETMVVRPDGRRLAATVTVFDPKRDLAMLRVPGLGQTPLQLAGGRVGTTVAVFGHPEGQGAVRVAPADIRQQVNAVGRDLYGNGLVRRSIFVLAAHLEPGDSGGGLVDGDGRVVGVAFAISPDRDDLAYALSTDEVVPVLELARQAGSTPADTGPCIDSD
ncbi:MAG: MarP family serine protease [Acidimicrobiales bacterium]